MSCPCLRDPERVHAGCLRPGEEVWLPNGTWIRHDWTDDLGIAPQGMITFVPDEGAEVVVPADALLARRSR